MIKAIIFDMDGVLIDSKKAWFILFNKSLQHFEGRTVDRKEFEDKIWANNFNETAHEYFNASLDAIRDYYHESYGTFKANLGSFTDTSLALSKLKKSGFKLAVATNTHREHAKRVLKDVLLVDYFDLVIGGDDVANGKPEPDIILEAVKRMDIGKEYILYVGDTVWDKIACTRAGVKFVGFKIDGDIRIEKLLELDKIIARHGIL